MSTDRELLELAAKAAGVTGRYFWNINDAGIETQGGGVWNPLDDDGQALRLAVKLRLTVKQRDDHAKVGWTGCVEWVGEGWAMCDEHVRGKATRRAIVRAAAEIGRAMP